MAIKIPRSQFCDLSDHQALAATAQKVVQDCLKEKSFSPILCLVACYIDALSGGKRWLYLAALGLADEALFFWPRWWRGHRLTRNYGLSVQNFRGWLWDYVKEKILSGLFIGKGGMLLHPFLVKQWVFGCST